MMSVEKEEQLKQLFQEINSPSKNLNHNIMQKIRLEAVNETAQPESNLLWKMVYWMIGGLFLVGLIYSINFLKISSNLNIWLMFLAAIIPFSIDVLLRRSRLSLI